MRSNLAVCAHAFPDEEAGPAAPFGCACAAAGLHAYPTHAIKSVIVDGQVASFELRPYLDESLPQHVLEGMLALYPPGFIVHL